MEPKYSRQDLSLKIDHEGGIEEALRYGISPEDVPQSLRHDWAHLISLFEQFDRQWRTIQAQLPDPW